MEANTFAWGKHTSTPPAQASTWAGHLAVLLGFLRWALGVLVLQH